MAKILENHIDTDEVFQREITAELGVVRSSLTNLFEHHRAASYDQPYALHVIGMIEAGEQYGWDSDRLVTQIALKEEQLTRDPSNQELIDELDRFRDALTLVVEKEKGSDYYRFIVSEATTLDIIDDARMRVMRRQFERGDRSMFEELSRNGDVTGVLESPAIKEFLASAGFDERLAQDPEFISALHIFAAAKEQTITSRVKADTKKTDQEAQRESTHDKVVARFAIRNLKDTALRKITGESPEKQRDFFAKHYGLFGNLDQNLRVMLEKETGDRKYEGDKVHEIAQQVWEYIVQDWQKTRKGFKLLALGTIAGVSGAVIGSVVVPYIAGTLLHIVTGGGLAAKLGAAYLPYRIGRSTLGSAAVGALIANTGLGKLLSGLDTKISAFVDQKLTAEKIKKETEVLPGGHSVEEWKNRLFDKQENDCAQEAERFVAVRGLKKFLTFVGKNPLRTLVSGAFGYEFAANVDASTLASLDLTPPAEAATRIRPPAVGEVKEHIPLKPGRSTALGAKILDHKNIELTPANITKYISTPYDLTPEEGKAIIYVPPEWNNHHTGDSIPKTFTDFAKKYELHKVVLVDGVTNKGILQKPFLMTSGGDTYVQKGDDLRTWESVPSAPQSLEINSTPEPATMRRDALPKVEQGKQVEFTKDKMVYFVSNEDWKKFGRRSALLPPGQDVTYVSSGLLGKYGPTHFRTPVIVVEDDRMWSEKTSGPKKGLLQTIGDWVTRKEVLKGVTVKPLDRQIIDMPPRPVMKPWVVPDHGTKKVPRPITTPTPEPTPRPTPKPTTEPTVRPTAPPRPTHPPEQATPKPESVHKPKPRPTPKLETWPVKIKPTVEPTTRPAVEHPVKQTPKPEPVHKPKPRPTPKLETWPVKIKPTVEPTTRPAVEHPVKQTPKPEPVHKPKPIHTPRPTGTPEPTARPVAKPTATPRPAASVEPSPKPKPSPTPKTEPLPTTRPTQAPPSVEPKHPAGGKDKTIHNEQAVPVKAPEKPLRHLPVFDSSKKLASFLGLEKEHGFSVRMQSGTPVISGTLGAGELLEGKTSQDQALRVLLTGIYAEKLHNLYGTKPIPWHELGAIENVIANIQDPQVVEHFVGKKVSLFSFHEKTGTVQMAYNPVVLDKLLDHARAQRSDQLTDFAMRTDRSLWEERLLGLNKVEDSSHPGAVPHEKQSVEKKGAAHETHGKKAKFVREEEYPKKKVVPAEQGRARTGMDPQRVHTGEQVIPQRGPVVPPFSEELPGSPAYQARGGAIPIDTFPIDQRGTVSGSVSGTGEMPASRSAVAPSSQGTSVSVPAERVDITPPPQEAKGIPPAAPRVAPSAESPRVEKGASQQGVVQEQAVSPERQYILLLDTMQKKFAIPPRFMEMVDDRTVHDFGDTIRTMLADARKTNPGEVSAFMDEGSLSGLLKNLFVQSLDQQDFVLPDELSSIDYHHLVKLFSILESKHPSLLDGKLTVKDFLLKKGL